MTDGPLNDLGQPVGQPVDGSFPRPRPERRVNEGRYVRLAFRIKQASIYSFWVE